MENSDDIHFDVRGFAGIITLDRPKALNALTHDQVRKIRTSLENWLTDDRIRHVIICSTCEKAFSAGGDVLDLYRAGTAQDPNILDFFADEYSLNAYIKRYPKPYIALINGIVMGGGVGVSVHGSHRVGGKGTKFAMPEVGIGFFPDVGGTYFLPRMPNNVGAYCALTGNKLNLADAVRAEIITHPVSAESIKDFEDLIQALEQSTNIDGTLQEFAVDPGDSDLFKRASTIETVFGRQSVAEIMHALQAVDGEDREWARKMHATIAKHSPISLHIALEQLKRGAELCFDDCMVMEYRIVARILQQKDFYEGVRALLIDKDGRPNWRQFDESEIVKECERYFQIPSGGDLILK